MLNKAYLLARQVHRLLVVLVVLLGLIMAATGSLLRFPNFALSLHLPLGNIRSWHASFSLYFALVFILMAITGLTMYLFPYLRKIKKG